MRWIDEWIAAGGRWALALGLAMGIAVFDTLDTGARDHHLLRIWKPSTITA